MNQHGAMTTLQERYQIAELATGGRTDAAIAAALGCAPGTVRKWRRRYQRQGRAGLASCRGRPQTGALGTCPAALRTALTDLRRAHPAWGPTTLLTELAATDAWRETALPSRARTAAFLRQEGLTRPYQRQTHLPQPAATPPTAPHAEWQMDAQGAKPVDGVGKVSVINVVDVFSRVKAESYPHLWGSAPDTTDYYLVLRRAFLSYGLPWRISLDHESVFYDNTTPSPFPTQLHLWLVALNVEVRFIGKRRPTEHAQVERMHQTMTAQALCGVHGTTPAALWADLDARRAALNSAIPSRALGGQPPLLVYPAAAHSGRPYRPEWERELLDPERVYRYLAPTRWFRKTNIYGEFFIGHQRYSFGSHMPYRMLEITVQADSHEFVVQPEGRAAATRFAIKGLAKDELMGDLAALLALPAYQLMLPLTRQDVQQLAAGRLLSGTTL